jgi:hypothetical protein
MTKLVRRFFNIRDMLAHATFCGKSRGAALSSRLDRGSQYGERTRRLGEARMFACRAVLVLTALLISLMPLTEHLYRWDKFLQGGSDVEFGILCLLLFAGLVLLIAHRAVTTPLLVLLAHRLIASPLRCPGMSEQASFLHQARCSQKAFPALSLPEMPLRI